MVRTLNLEEAIRQALQEVMLELFNIFLSGLKRGDDQDIADYMTLYMVSKTELSVAAEGFSLHQAEFTSSSAT